MLFPENPRPRHSHEVLYPTFIRVPKPPIIPFRIFRGRSEAAQMSAYERQKGKVRP